MHAHDPARVCFSHAGHQSYSGFARQLPAYGDDYGGLRRDNLRITLGLMPYGPTETGASLGLANLVFKIT